MKERYYKVSETELMDLIIGEMAEILIKDYEEISCE